MEDVSDPPFRAVCKDHGADLMYTEFISSEGVLTYQHKLILPPSDDGERVNMTLAGIYFDRVPAEAS